jgi:UDP-hydrolysing UDP-N-acetyl-D-glucosamine 2-epimerase
MSRLKICIVTGSRADYGLFYWLMQDIKSDPDLQLQVTVTGMHLAPEYGETWRIIEQDGFSIDAKVETQLASDTAVGVAKTVGLGLIGFADTFQQLLPDLVILLGDRYEMYAAAQAAYFARIPIAHIAGGDVTEGAFDEAIRHSITKMSALHFVTNSDSARRVEQLGESPDRIFNVGSPGIDTLLRAQRLSLHELESSLGVAFNRRIFLVTFHPTTLDTQTPQAQVEELCTALKLWLDGTTSIVCTKPNADAGGRVIASRLEAFANEAENFHLFESLGQLRYLSLMALCDVVIGNSSSGLYEAPSFQKPVVNIGDRQKGRLAANSVIQVDCKAEAISEAINQALTIDCSMTVNPYGDGTASNRILDTIKNTDLSTTITQKHFYDL